MTMLAKRVSLAFAAALMSISPCLGVRAEDKSPSDQTPPDQTWTIGKIIAPVPGETACYRRAYDAGHLRRTPRQQTAEITLSLQVFGNDKTGEVASTHPDSIQTAWMLGLRLRHARKVLHAGGDCSDRSGEAVCGVDCDGGHIVLAKPATGDGLLVRLDNVRFDGECEETGFHFKRDGGDKLFRLERAPAESCDFLVKGSPAR
jgi:hypothetical protein